MLIWSLLLKPTILVYSIGKIRNNKFVFKKFMLKKFYGKTT